MLPIEVKALTSMFAKHKKPSQLQHLLEKSDMVLPWSFTTFYNTYHGLTSLGILQQRSIFCAVFSNQQLLPSPSVLVEHRLGVTGTLHCRGSHWGLHEPATTHEKHCRNEHICDDNESYYIYIYTMQQYICKHINQNHKWIHQICTLPNLVKSTCAKGL